MATNTWYPAALSLPDVGLVDSLGFPSFGFGDWVPLSVQFPAMRRLVAGSGGHYGWAPTLYADVPEEVSKDTSADADVLLACQFWTERLAAQSLAGGALAFSIHCKSRDGDGLLDTMRWSLSRVHETNGWQEYLVASEEASIIPPGTDYAGSYVTGTYPAVDLDDGDRLVLEIGFKGSSEGITIGMGLVDGSSVYQPHAAVDGDTTGNGGWFGLEETLELAGGEVLFEAWDGMTGPEGNNPSLLGMVAMGQGASEGMGASARDSRWLSLLAAQARTYHGSPSTAPGYVPAGYSVPLATAFSWAQGGPGGGSEFEYVNGATGTTGVVAGETGLGLRVVTLPAAGDGVDCAQAEDPGGGFDPALILFTGTTSEMDVLQNYGGIWETEQVSGDYASWQTVTGKAGEGAHEIRGRAAGVPTNLMGAIYASADEQNNFQGIVPIDASATDVLAVDVAAALGADGAPPTFPMLQAAWWTEPGVIFVEYGAQEYVSASSTARELQAALVTIIGAIQCRYSTDFGSGTRYRPTVVVVEPAEPDAGLVDGGQTESWSDYTTAMTVAAAATGASYWSWGLLSPATDDGQHPNDAGHLTIANDGADLLQVVPSGPVTTGPFTGWGIPI